MNKTILTNETLLVIKYHSVIRQPYLRVAKKDYIVVRGECQEKEFKALAQF